MNKPRVLVVDDEPGLLHAVQRILGREAEVQTCADATAALAQAAVFKPELAIVDVRMPGLDGFALMAKLKALRPELDVVLMTGSAQEVDAQLARALREAAFFFLQKPFERELLLTLFERWRQLRRLADENRHHLARLEQELRDAHTFQQSMLPPRSASIGRVRLEQRYVPCHDVGGDFVDWADAGDGGVALLVADVSGHGVRAAMLTGIVKSVFHAAHAACHAPDVVVARVHDSIRAFDDALFVSVLCARLTPAKQRLELVSAGHGKALLIPRRGPPQALLATGPVAAAASQARPWPPRVLPFDAGDRLLVWTDGLDETHGPHGELFGEDAVFALATGTRGGIGALLDEILAARDAFRAGRPPQDDCTLLAAEVAVG